MPTTTFRDLIADNQRKSLWLVVGFCLFAFIVVFVLSMAVIIYMQGGDEPPWHLALAISGFVTLAAALYCFYSFYEGDKFVLGISGAHPIKKEDDPQLFNVVEEMAIAAGVPMPAVYLIPDAAPNAFATGRDPEHAAVAITTGLRTKLTREELQGVMAHEMGHIRNFDIRLMLLLTMLIGTIVLLTDIFWRILWYAPPADRTQSSSRDDNKKGGNPLMLVLLVAAILLAIIAPLLAQILQLAVSRQREYLADASAVEFTRDPLGLANALKKLEADPAELKHANRGTAHLYIVNPIKKFQDRAATVFASHPPIQDRIARLESLVNR